MKTSPTLSLCHFIRSSWSYTKGDRPRTYLFLALLVAANVVLLAPPWIIARLINGFQGNSSPEEVWRHTISAVVAFFLLTAFAKLTHHLARYIQLQVGYYVRMKSLQDFTLRSFNQPLPWHLVNSAGEVGSRAEKAAGAVGTMIGDLYFQGIGVFVRIIGAVSVLFLMTGPTITLVLLGIIGTLTIMAWSNRPLMETNAAMAGFNARLVGRIVSGLGCVLSLKSFRSVTQMQPVLFAPVAEGREIARRQAFLNELKWALTDLCHPTIVGLAIVLFVSAKLQSTGNRDIGELYVLLEYISTIFASIWQLTLTYGQALEATASFNASVDFLSNEQESAPVASISSTETIEVKAITLSTGRFNLGPVTTQFAPGERIALIGKSGSGKSTLLHILSGLKRASTGDICMGRERIIPGEKDNFALYIPQLPEILDESLRTNLSLGHDLDEALLLRGLNTARLTPLLDTLPYGLDTELGPNGSSLSGGQRQRVALARASLRLHQFKMVLFDEPTSSLDEKTEEAVIKEILGSLTSQVLLFSLHRLSLLKWFSRVIVFDDGKILFDGPSHEFKSSPHALGVMTLDTAA